MEIPGLNRARAGLLHALRHGDRALLAALALLAVAATVHWGGSVPAADRIEQLKQDAAAARRQVHASPRELPRGDPLSSGARMEDFYRFFPTQDSAPDWFEKIHQAAAKQGLQLPEADYRIVPVKGTRLVAYQVSYPVQGSYSQLRRFLTQVLRELPMASLDDVDFYREAISEAEVQATVTLTLHVKERP